MFEKFKDLRVTSKTFEKSNVFSFCINYSAEQEDVSENCMLLFAHCKGVSFLGEVFPIT